MKFLIRDVVPLTLIITVLVCSNCDQLSDSGKFDSSTDSDCLPAIAGMFLCPDGVSPASGAVVTLQPRSVTTEITGAAKRVTNKQTVLTGADGSFIIDSCTTGVYTIEGIDEKGTAIRIDSVVVVDDQTTTQLPCRTLQLTGALCGEVHLNEGGDPSNVFILVFGSDRFIQVSNDGTFFMDNLPYGNYELKVVCILREYGESHTVATVVVPDDTVSIGTITLESQEHCVPQNVSLVYDSMRCAVTLQWNGCTGADLQGYNVYRYNSSETDQYGKDPLNGTIISGTSFVDALIKQNQTYVYGIAAVFTGGINGRKSNPLEVTTPFSFFRADTLDQIDSMIPEGVYWNNNNDLVVAYTSPRLLSVIDYQHDGTPLRRTDISLPYNTEYRRRSVIVDNDNIYVIMNLFDSTIQSFDRDGLKRYECNFHHPIRHWCVRNDTIFAGLDAAGSYCTNAFDKTGKFLYQVNTPDSSFPYTYAVCAKDGRIISARGLKMDKCILQVNGDEGKKVPKFPDGAIYFLDACADRYLFSQDKALVIVNADNEHVARFTLSEVIFPIYRKDASINCQGTIAYIQKKNVIVVTLP